MVKNNDDLLAILTNFGRRINDHVVQLDDLSTSNEACFLLGYLSQKAVEIEPEYNKQLFEKILNEEIVIDEKLITKILPKIVFILTKKMYGGEAIDRKLLIIEEELFPHLSMLLIHIRHKDGVEFDKDNSNLYFKIGFETSHVFLKDDVLMVSNE